MREGTVIGPLIVAIGVVVAAIALAVVGALLDTADGSTELRLERAEAETAQLRTRIDALDTELRTVQADLDALAEDVALGAAAPARTAAPDLATGSGMLAPVILGQDEGEGDPPPGTEAMTEVMNLAKDRFNTGITQPRNAVMLEVLGAPRAGKTVDCSGVTQPRLKALLETRQVGPIRVTMLKPALDSLERIVARLRETEPDIHDALGTAGALCARLIRGSSSSWSNHSWGTAIDLKLEGQLDGFGDGGTQFGLLLLAELFNEEGWYWGATYSREDSMHFEVGVETLRKWQAEGLL